MQSNTGAKARPDFKTSLTYNAGAHGRPALPFDPKSTRYADDSMIGMALGSPSHPPPFVIDVIDPDPLIPKENDDRGHDKHEETERSSKARARGWKKFGELFKLKNNPSGLSSAVDTPFYQLQHTEPDDDMVDSKPLPPPKDLPRADQGFDVAPSATNSKVSTNNTAGRTTDLLRAKLPRLDVSIPDVQLDRYSVMFGDLLNNQQKANLLARRSRVLEKLKTTSDDNLIPAVPQLDQSEDNDFLKPRPSPRRATSPTPTKSPMFSLFPQPPSTTPRKAAARLSQAKRASLQRSHTAPSRLSPMQESFGDNKPVAVKAYTTKHYDSTSSLIETSASTTKAASWSTDGSYLSPNSSVSSLGEDEILFDVKKLSMVTENQEPQYEVTKPDGAAVELYRALSVKIKAAKEPALPPSSKLSSKYSVTTIIPDKKDKAISVVEDSTEQPLSTSVTAKISAAKARRDRDAGSQPAPAIATIEESADEAVIPTPQLTEKVELEVVLPVEASAEETQDMIAAAVEETLKHMETQSEARAATPICDSPELRTSTPEKPVKLLAIPQNIPISKYALRSSSPSSLEKTLPEARPFSPTPQRAATDPVTEDQSFAARAKRLAATADTDASVREWKANRERKDAVPSSKDGKSRNRPTKPELTITASKTSSIAMSLASAPSPTEVAVARQVSLTRKQSKRLLVPPIRRLEGRQAEGGEKRLLVPPTRRLEGLQAEESEKRLLVPPTRRLEGLQTEEGEKMVNSHALTPVIVDANKAHRPGKSMALVIENA